MIDHRCCWAEVGVSPTDWSGINPRNNGKDRHDQAENVSCQDRTKERRDRKRKPMEFEFGCVFWDRVMLKVSPWKGVIRFGKRGKLNPRYVRPFKVLAKVGKVSYRLETSKELSRGLKRKRIPLVKVAGTLGGALFT
ncbi:hypothetical protein Tco_0421408 [Tanacetum coccineum]